MHIPHPAIVPLLLGAAKGDLVVSLHDMEAPVGMAVLGTVTGYLTFEDANAYEQISLVASFDAAGGLGGWISAEMFLRPALS